MITSGPRRRGALAVAVLALVGTVGTTSSAMAATGSPSSPPQASPSASTAPSAAPTSAPNTFGLGPSSATGPDGRAVFNVAATPGGVIRDHVAVLNYSVKPLSLQIYATDAVATDNGQFALENGDVDPTGLGAWITLDSPRDIVVPGRSATGPGLVVVPTLIRVPRDAVPGDRAGGIIVSLTASAATGDQQGVSLEQRVATRVYLRVSGELAPALELTDLTAEYQGTLNPAGSGRALVTYTVRNTGNVRLALAPAVTVSGLVGSWKAAATDPEPVLLPGGSVTLQSDIDGVLPLGPLTADVTVVPGAVAGGTVSLPAPLTASVTFWAVPWVALGILVAMIVGGLLWRRRRRLAAAPATSEQAPVPVG